MAFARFARDLGHPPTILPIEGESEIWAIGGESEILANRVNAIDPYGIFRHSKHRSRSL